MTFVYWLYRAERAYKNAKPSTPLGKSPSIHQKKVQTLLQLMCANKALSEMANMGITSGASYNKAIALKEWAIFAREAMASPWPWP